MDNKTNKSVKFSVFITVSENKTYLEQATNSVINQTLDFTENIQIIFINHNNLHSSFLDNLHNKYPENITILSDKYLNQPYAQSNIFKVPLGQYVAFLDCEDYYSLNTFENINHFINKNDVNIISTPLYYITRKNKEHELNYKYKEDRIIDLEKEDNNPQINLKSCFVKKSLLQKYNYDKENLFSNETLFINQLLLDSPQIGVVNNAKYYIRDSYSIKLLLEDTVLARQMIARINVIYKELIRMAKIKYGEMPLFILYTIAYDLQHILRIPEIDFLTKKEKKQLFEDLKEIIGYLSDDVIYNNHNINSRLRSFYIYLKKGTYNICEEEKNLVMKTENYLIDDLNRHKIWLDIVDIKDSKLNISGLLLTNFYLESIKINLIKEDINGNRQVIPSKYVFYPQDERKILKFISVPWRFDYNFDVSADLHNLNHFKFSFEVVYEENNITFKYNPKIEFRISTGFSHLSIYSVNNNFIIFKDSSSISVIPYTFKKMFKFEIKNILKIFSSKEKGKYSASFYHLLYLLLYPVMSKKKICLINDRLDRADENGIHLFKYASKQNDGINKYYILDKDCEDYKRLKKDYGGNILAYNSFKHKILYLFVDKRISSFLNELFFNPFYNEDKDNRKFYNNLIDAPQYFIQHGVIYRDLTSHIKRYDHNLALIVTSSERERQSFFDLDYHFSEDVVQILGLPRYDNLIKDNKVKKQILFTPTWRLQLERDESLFFNSDYYHMLNDFLNNEELFKLLEEHGYKFIFKPHPQLLKFIDSFEMNENVIISTEESYQELIRDSALMISDVSSVISDFAYLKKPIIYYQKNNDHHFEPFFDYVTEGFGDVLKDEEDVIQKVKYYLENNCVMEEKYKKRVSNFFKYNDKNNCKRVYDWIINH